MFHHFRVLSLYCGFVSCVLISRRAHVLVFSAFTFPDSLLENTEASVFFSLAFTLPPNIQGAAERTVRFGRSIASGGEGVQWWRARRRTAVYVPFSVYTMAWSGEHRAFIVEEFIKNGASPVARQWPPRSPDLTPCDFFLWGCLKAKVYEQRPQTLEVLKEAIRQEVAAITPGMILKVTDSYRERLHQRINIQGRHLSDVLFKTC